MRAKERARERDYTLRSVTNDSADLARVGHGKRLRPYVVKKEYP